jgi:magnesium chelatase family protein
MSDIIGQPLARRAMEIAAAGGHNVLLSGPPGTGKTLLASRLPGILPSMSEAEALETAAIASVCGQMLGRGSWGIRPFRAPHHTASAIALVGGGSSPRPGEISLAHNGVLFLDELPEFSRHVLEVLREPMESGRILISRATQQAEFPARFQLVCAMNPCPCGMAGDASGQCGCSAEQIQRYRNRISGPLLDRIDLQIPVLRPPEGYLTGEEELGECTAAVRQRVEQARRVQQQRAGRANARLSIEGIRRHCALTPESQTCLQQAAKQFLLSHRACHRIIKVARTIADLDQCQAINLTHLAEAIALRRPAANGEQQSRQTPMHE